MKQTNDMKQSEQARLTSQPPILRLENVTFYYPQTSLPAVDKLSLELAKGDVLGLVGPSGCGKTTLLRIIAGFESLQAGIVELDGQQVAGKGCWIPPEQRRVGIVFQDHALFPHLNVIQNIAFGLHSDPLRRKDKAALRNRQQQIMAMLELIGLEGLEYRYPYELSGGQQQRVALARTLAPQPKLVLLDEPLSNLDMQIRLRLREEVREILKVTGTSAIFVTHDQQEALAMADSIAVMHQGQLEQIGKPEQIYTQPVSRFVATFMNQVNILPAQRCEQVWETEVGNFSVTTPTNAHIGELLIQEKDVLLHPDPDAGAVIRTRQFLGREYRYGIETPSGKKLHARIPPETILSIGTRVQVSVVNQSVKFFAVDRS
jgi:iron(III) transport system ATP-binding protein